MSEYIKAFNKDVENGASKHILTAENENLLLSVDCLVEKGVVVGQTEMFSGDVIYFLSPEAANPALKPCKLDGSPLYITPEERLKRPTEVEIKSKRGRIV